MRLISLRVAAYSLHQAKSALGAFYRRLRTKLGAPKAITATAHKLARTVYRMLKCRKEYVDVGQEQYESQYRTRLIISMERRAKELGYKLMRVDGLNPASSI